MEFDAELRNWVIAGSFIYGEIYGDKKGRFHDGCAVKTSTIQDLNKREGWVKTRNSTYKLA